MNPKLILACLLALIVVMHPWAVLGLELAALAFIASRIARSAGLRRYVAARRWHAWAP